MEGTVVRVGRDHDSMVAPSGRATKGRMTQVRGRSSLIKALAIRQG